MDGKLNCFKICEFIPNKIYMIYISIIYNVVN